MGQQQGCRWAQGRCLVVSPGSGLDPRCLSSPCPAPDADGYALSRKLVANLQLLVSLCAAFTTGFGLTTGMKKMGVRHEPTAGGALGNLSVTMGRSVLPMICEFLCFESTLSVTVPTLTWGMGFPSQRVSVTFDGLHETSTEIMKKQILC